MATETSTGGVSTRGGQAVRHELPAVGKPPPIEVQAVGSHRNGIAGESFDLVLFSASDVRDQVQPLIGIVFPRKWHVAVLSIPALAAGDLDGFGTKFRGDDLQDALRAAVAAHADVRSAEAEVAYRRRLLDDTRYELASLPLGANHALEASQVKTAAAQEDLRAALISLRRARKARRGHKLFRWRPRERL